MEALGPAASSEPDAVVFSTTGIACGRSVEIFAKAVEGGELLAFELKLPDGEVVNQVDEAAELEERTSAQRPKLEFLRNKGLRTTCINLYRLLDLKNAKIDLMMTEMGAMNA